MTELEKKIDKPNNANHFIKYEYFKIKDNKGHFHRNGCLVGTLQEFEGKVYIVVGTSYYNYTHEDNPFDQDLAYHIAFNRAMKGNFCCPTSQRAKWSKFVNRCHRYFQGQEIHPDIKKDFKDYNIR